jgi:hypothetical protein
MYQSICRFFCFTLLAVVSTLAISEVEILQPESWSFPEVVESARKICPKNLEGITFNEFGLAYTSEQVSKLDFSRMRPEKLQNYADIVTHAYPDAVGAQLSCNCSSIPIESLNETAIAGIAHVSINAKNEKVRTCAKACLIIIQGNLQDSK